MDFAKRLKRLRENANLSQKELAEKLGMTAQSYNNYEKRGYDPKPEMLVNLAIALNTDVNKLLGFKPDALNQAKKIADEVGMEYTDDGDGYIIIKRNVEGEAPAVAGAIPSTVGYIKADYKAFINFILNASQKADADLKSVKNRLILFYAQGFKPPKPPVSSHTHVSSRFTHSAHTHTISSSTISSSTLPHHLTGSTTMQHYSNTDEEDD